MSGQKVMQKVTGNGGAMAVATQPQGQCVVSQTMLGSQQPTQIINPLQVSPLVFREFFGSLHVLLFSHCLRLCIRATNKFVRFCKRWRNYCLIPPFRVYKYALESCR